MARFKFPKRITMAVLVEEVGEVARALLTLIGLVLWSLMGGA